jgi:hypothetical protein
MTLTGWALIVIEGAILCLVVIFIAHLIGYIGGSDDE